MRTRKIILVITTLTAGLMLYPQTSLAEIRELTECQMESITGKSGIFISIDTIGSDWGAEIITDRRVCDTGSLFISEYLDKIDYAMYRELEAICSNTITNSILMKTILENIVNSVNSFNIDSITLDLPLPHTDGVDLGSMEIQGVNKNNSVNISY